MKEEMTSKPLIGASADYTATNTDNTLPEALPSLFLKCINMYDSFPPFGFAGPSSDGGFMVQNVHNNQAVVVHLADLPSSKVRLPSFVSHLPGAYRCRIKTFHWELLGTFHAASDSFYTSLRTCR
jgi:hypothetical protein